MAKAAAGMISALNHPPTTRAARPPNATRKGCGSHNQTLIQIRPGQFLVGAGL